MTELAGIVDIHTSVPTAVRIAYDLASWGSLPGYRRIFGEKWANRVGLDTEVLSKLWTLKGDRYLPEAAAILQDHLPPPREYVEMLRTAGVTTAVVHGPLVVGDVTRINDDTASLVAAAPDVLVGFGRMDPATGEDMRTEARRCTSELGLCGLSITPFWHGISCDDPLLAPLFESARDLGLPVWIHQSTNLKVDAPLDIEAPHHLDRLAGRYPEVDLIVGHGGWPWSQETVAIAWRHQNVYIETSAFRPRNIFSAGSGWEPFVYYGQRVLQERVLFGSTWSMVGLTPSQMVEEAANVPWPDDIKARWLNANGTALLAKRRRG